MATTAATSTFESDDTAPLVLLVCSSAPLEAAELKQHLSGKVVSAWQHSEETAVRAQGERSRDAHKPFSAPTAAVLASG